MSEELKLKDLINVECDGACRTNTGSAINRNDGNLDLERLEKVMLNSSLHSRLLNDLKDSKKFPEYREFIQAQFIKSVNDLFNVALSWMENREIN